MPARSTIEAATPARLPYATPHLRCFGDVRDVTLGGSPGVGDSGGSFVEKTF
jgi:hypothetical protein